MIDNTMKKIIAVSVVVILAIAVGIIIFNEKNKERYSWQEWANQVNECTDYYLDKGTYGSCGYIKTIGSDYSTTISVNTNSSGTINYCKAHINDKGIVLEWYQKTSSRTYHTSTTYIPFDSICYAQSNEVNQ